MFKGYSTVSMAGDLGDSLINQGSPESSYPLQSGCRCDLYSGHGHGYSTVSMAGDLWDAPILQGPPESSYPMQSGWQCDFYSGHGHDVIEEDALNEKACLKVLRILIADKDAEIDELEKQLVLLQIQLACAEHEGLFKICCDSLREKIDLLDISIKNLRNNDENDIMVQLPTHEKPAEKIQEILKALLQKYLQEKDDQPADTIVKVSSSDSLIASGFYNNKTNSCNSDLPVNGNTEVRKQHPTAEKYKILNSSLNLDENGMLQKADQPTAQSAVDNGKNESSESQLGASRIAKKKNCGRERKLIDFIQETAQQECIKDSKVTMRQRYSKIQRYQKKWKTNSNLPSTTEGKDLAANFHSSDLLSDATDGGSSKEDLQIKLPSSLDNDSSTWAIVPFAGANDECSSLAIIPFGAASGQCNALAITPFASANDDCSTSAIIPFASADDDFSPLAIVPAREKNFVDMTLPELKAVARQIVPAREKNFVDMTLPELKAVARQNKLKGCYKLRKKALIEFLEDRLGR